MVKTKGGRRDTAGDGVTTACQCLLRNSSLQRKETQKSRAHTREKTRHESCNERNHREAEPTPVRRHTTRAASVRKHSRKGCPGSPKCKKEVSVSAGRPGKGPRGRGSSRETEAGVPPGRPGQRGTHLVSLHDASFLDLQQLTWRYVKRYVCNAHKHSPHYFGLALLQTPRTPAVTRTESPSQSFCSNCFESLWPFPSRGECLSLQCLCFHGNAQGKPDCLPTSASTGFGTISREQANCKRCRKRSCPELVGSKGCNL